MFGNVIFFKLNNSPPSIFNIYCKESSKQKKIFINIKANSSSEGQIQSSKTTSKGNREIALVIKYSSDSFIFSLLKTITASCSNTIAVDVCTTSTLSLEPRPATEPILYYHQPPFINPLSILHTFIWKPFRTSRLAFDRRWTRHQHLQHHGGCWHQHPWRET